MSNPFVCRPCGEAFGSLKAFDAHRVGRHDLDFPEHLDGRRCLEEPELLEATNPRTGCRVFARNSRGTWSLAADVEDAGYQTRRLREASVA